MHRSGLGSLAGRSVALAAALLSVNGCSCEAPGTTPDLDAASYDAGPLFGGIDAPGYSPFDAGPLPPEPCAVPMRRVTFPLGDASLGHTNHFWAFDSYAWVYLGGFSGPGSPPPSLHLFDLAAEREIDNDVPVSETSGDRVAAVFEAPGGFALVHAEAAGALHLVHVGTDGRVMGPRETLALSNPPLARTDDGRFIGMMLAESVSDPRPATLEIASPSGPVQRIELGFMATSGHLTRLQWTDGVLVGVGYEDSTRSLRAFEVDLDSGAVRLGTVVEGVRPAGFGLNGTMALWAANGSATVALSYQPADEARGPHHAELFWWNLGEDTVVRQLVRPATDHFVSILALGGTTPTQTVVVGEGVGFRTWVLAARVLAPGEVVGGGSPLGVVGTVDDAAAWSGGDGTSVVALLSEHQLEVFYLCEGAM